MADGRGDRVVAGQQLVQALAQILLQVGAGGQQGGTGDGAYANQGHAVVGPFQDALQGVFPGRGGRGQGTVRRQGTGGAVQAESPSVSVSPLVLLRGQGKSR